MEENKYELTDETIDFCCHRLHRIKAMKDFRCNGFFIKKGDLGGYIEKEYNLSQEYECWVYDNAMVCDNAQVYDNARVYGNAQIYDNACVYGNAQVSDNALVFGNARVREQAEIYGDARVRGNAEIFGNSKVYGNARVDEFARVYDNAQIYENATVHDNAYIGDNAQIFDNVRVFGYAEIIGDAEVKDISDYIIFKNSWSSGRYFTWTKSNDMWRVGCFYGTGEELIKKAYKDSDKSGKNYELTVKYVEDLNK